MEGWGFWFQPIFSLTLQRDVLFIGMPIPELVVAAAEVVGSNNPTRSTSICNMEFPKS
jgi:hypothetical protein